jgi:hypothetical protein
MMILRHLSIPFLAAALWVGVPGVAPAPASASEDGKPPAADQKKAPAAEEPAPESPPPPGSRPATEEEQKAAVGAIEAQLQAFRDNDYRKAMRYQSSGLRRNAPDPEDLRRMIVQSYPQFARYRTAVFGKAHCSRNGQMLQVPVRVTGQDGVTVHAVYLMEKESGEWRVASVFSPVRPRTRPDEIV